MKRKINIIGLDISGDLYKSTQITRKENKLKCTQFDVNTNNHRNRYHTKMFELRLAAGTYY